MTAMSGLKWETLICLQRYQHLFDANAKHSFYLQSKVHRAWERIQEEVREAGSKP